MRCVGSDGAEDGADVASSDLQDGLSRESEGAAQPFISWTTNDDRPEAISEGIDRGIAVNVLHKYK